jgi:hypothetical protein
MPKPPKSTPNSDIDGVHRDEARNTDVAARKGQSAETLENARKGSTARPTAVDDKKNRDDRSK